MKKAILVSIFMALMNANNLIAGDASCLQKARTQLESNECSNIQYKEADAELNRVYNLIKKLYKDDKVFLEKLKISQRCWIKLRDADIDLQFPEEDKQKIYGSIFPMCASDLMTELTLQRVFFLKRWVTGAKEGDVCSGSIMHCSIIEESQYKQSN